MRLVLRAVASAMLCLTGTQVVSALDPSMPIDRCNRGVWRCSAGLPRNGITALASTRDGYLWVGTPGGLARFDGLSFAQFAPHDSAAMRDEFVTSLVAQPNGRLWIGTRAGLLLRGLDRQLRAVTTDELAPDTYIRALAAGRADALWIGTVTGTVSRWAGAHTQPVAVPARLTDTVIRALLEDADGTLWISGSTGLVSVRDGLVRELGAADGMTSEVVRSLAVTGDGLWVGTERGGLLRWTGGGLIQQSSRLGLADDETVWALLADSNGCLWAGTEGSGVRRLCGDDLSSLTTRGGLASDVVWSLHEDAEGSIWIGTGGDGVIRWCDGERVPVQPDGCLPSDVVRVVHTGRDGRVWIGSEGGLTVIGDGVCSTLASADGLPSDFVYALHEDANGVLWIGTGRGLARVDRGRVTAFANTRDLPHDVVFQILEDDDGNLWVSSSHGIARVDRGSLDLVARDGVARLSVRLFAEGDGMWSSECNGGTQPAGCRSSDGRMWFPTSLGLCRIDPSRLRAEQSPPRVLIEAVVVDDRKLPPEEPLDLPPGTRRIEIQYTAPTFIAPRQVRFRYRLQGLDSAWIDVGDARSARFNRLPPGSYKLDVAARTHRRR